MTLTTQNPTGNTPATRCILWGGYAGGNTGDELTLAVALHDMQRRYGQSVAILSSHPGYTMRQFPGVEVIRYDPVRSASRSHRLWRTIALRISTRPVWSYRLQDQSCASDSWLSRIRCCKRLYLTGGGYLTDLFNLFEAHLLPVRAARAAGVEVATAPLGLGPFASPQAARKTTDSLLGATLVVRDQASLDFCTRRGLAATLVRDDGFRAADVIDLPLNSDAAPRAKPRIGLNISDQHGSNRPDHARSWWIHLLRALAGAPVEIEGFCFHVDMLQDYSLTTECFFAAGLVSSAVREPRLDFRAACRQLADFDLIVSSRLHAVIVGNLLGRTTFAVHDGDYYRNKMQAATRDYAYSSTLDVTKVSAREAARRILETTAMPAPGARGSGFGA